MGWNEMADNILIRPISDPDYDAVCSLEEDRGGCRYLSSVFVRQTMTLSPRSCLVAWNKDSPSGYLVGMCMPDDCTRAWILRIRVRDEMQRQGIGTALLNHAHAVLKNMGARLVSLSCSPENIGALSLYSCAGYLITGHSAGYFGPGEDRYILTRSLKED